jgi:hypothetical protein
MSVPQPSISATINALCELAIADIPSLRVMARVCEDDAVDLAVVTLSGAPLVVRCIETVRPADVLALQTMLAEGPFTRVLLVSRDPVQARRGEIPSCHIDDIDGALLELVSETR